ncbi:MAG: ABC transporter permease [Actinobacteria bacterium]|nr:ABC transporter permease [Actinomycetota bacterium]
MGKFFIHISVRLLTLVGILLVVSIGVFYLIHLLPGNPAYTILGPGATPTAVAKITRQLGLDRSLPAQYMTWLVRALRGNLGTSYTTYQPVTSAIGHALPVDIELVVISQLIAFAIAVPLAVSAARKSGSLIDRLATMFSFGFLSLPAFVIGVPLVLLFAVTIHWFPATGYTPIYKQFFTNLHEMLLPSITLALSSIAIYYRLLRSDLISTLQEDFVTLARSKGLSNREVMYRHVLRPSTFSLMTAAAINIGGLLGGAVVVEYLFALPGMGLLLVNSIYARDYLTTQGVILTLAVLFVLANFVVDMFYHLIDPRVANA